VATVIQYGDKAADYQMDVLARQVERAISAW
jgi:hypothetical protein